ncbi:MAG: hypothetical protein ACKVPX_12085 [Myxococcaceae bacterium]
MDSFSSAEAWIAHLSKLLANERNAAVEFLLSLAEFDRREVWRARGHANLIAFLHVELGMSQTLAYYRQTRRKTHPATSCHRGTSA